MNLSESNLFAGWTQAHEDPHQTADGAQSTLGGEMPHQRIELLLFDLLRTNGNQTARIFACLPALLQNLTRERLRAEQLVPPRC